MEGHQLHPHKTLSTVVVDAIAAAENIEPFELSDPLYSVVNTDALDELFRAATGRVTFEYLDYEVTVHATGQVDIDPLDSG